MQEWGDSGIEASAAGRSRSSCAAEREAETV